MFLASILFTLMAVSLCVGPLEIRITPIGEGASEENQIVVVVNETKDGIMYLETQSENDPSWKKIGVAGDNGQGESRTYESGEHTFVCRRPLPQGSNYRVALQPSRAGEAPICSQAVTRTPENTFVPVAPCTEKTEADPCKKDETDKKTGKKKDANGAASFATISTVLISSALMVACVL